MTTRRSDAQLPAVPSRVLSLWNGASVDPEQVYAAPCLIAGGPGCFQPEDALEDSLLGDSPFLTSVGKFEWFSAGERAPIWESLGARFP